MKRLGRTYPSDVQGTIVSLGASLDAMMAQSAMLVLLAGQDVRGEISKLNARLVNEVILVSNQITDDQAKGLLGEIQKDSAAVKAKFDQAGVSLAARPWAASPDTPHSIAREQVEALLRDWNQAFTLYPQIVERYGKLQGLDTAGPLLIQAFGADGPKMLAAVGDQLGKVDADVLTQKSMADRLTAKLAEGADPVQIDPGEYVQMSNWAADVFKAEEGIKRLEGAALQKRAEATLPERTSPWKTIAIASGGLAAVGAILYLAMKD